MTWNSERVAQEIELGEASRVEFKEARFAGAKVKAPAQKKIADELAALGNSSGGTLIFSVTDKPPRKAQPMDAAQLDALEKLIYQACGDSIRPPLSFEAHRIAMPDGVNVLVVDVEQGAVHESPGGYFQRHGSSVRKIPPEVLARLFAQRGYNGAVRFDARVVPGTGMHTLEPALYERFLSDRAGLSAEEQLSRLKLIGMDNGSVAGATAAGLLLCCENPDQYMPSAFIQAVCYRGLARDSGRQVDAEDITGPLDHQIISAVTFARRNMRIYARKEPMRVDMPQYSEKAVFEAVVNAAIHRDYSIHGSKIRLHLFEDRLELSSPGSLPGTLTVDTMRKYPQSRNETLAAMLGRIKIPENFYAAGDRERFLERRGEGMAIIFDETRQLTGREPVYEMLDDAELFLTLPAAPPHLGGLQAEVLVTAADRPLAGADVLAIYPNNTWKLAKTDTFGRANFNFHSELPMSVFCAAAGHKGRVERGWLPTEPLPVDLQPLAAGGSVIYSDSTGTIPGVSGMINPKLDKQERTYLYATNIAVNGGEQQPVHFKFEQELRLTDANGRELIVRIIKIIGRSVLLEYEPPA